MSIESIEARLAEQVGRIERIESSPSATMLDVTEFISDARRQTVTDDPLLIAVAKAAKEYRRAVAERMRWYSDSTVLRQDIAALALDAALSALEKGE